MTNWLATNPFKSNPESWEVSQQRLQALVAAEQDPTEEEVSEALKPIGLGNDLVAHEASRVMILSGGGPKAALKEALIPRSTPQLYDATEIVRSLRRRRSRPRRRMKKLTESERAQLDYLKREEKARLEEAREVEKSLGRGNWRARVYRRKAQDATRQRKKFEEKS